MQVFVRDHCTMIAAPVQCDVDEIPKGSHYVRVPIAIGRPNEKEIAFCSLILAPYWGTSGKRLHDGKPCFPVAAFLAAVIKRAGETKIRIAHSRFRKSKSFGSRGDGLGNLFCRSPDCHDPPSPRPRTSCHPHLLSQLPSK